MREPGTLTRGRDTKGRINALIEDLGLSQVSGTIIIVMMMMVIVTRPGCFCAKDCLDSVEMYT